MKILTIESTCDETAAAVVTDELAVLSSVVASQDELHQRFAGVVPEIAARAHVERILPVIDEALRRAGVRLADLDAIAVANTPGLAGSLLVGVVAAKTLALAAGKPLVAINHLHAHIYACRMAAGREVFPCVGLIVSGGHSSFYRCLRPTEFEYLGGTIDDAAGEAFDKVAAMLGLPYPGGPAIARAAERGNPRAYDFPRALLHERDRLELSFSGLKTAVRYALAGPGKPDFRALELSEQQVADLAASFQAAVVDALVAKSLLALERTGLSRLCVGGGVAANRLLRAKLTEATSRVGAELIIAPPELCTDNAVMGAIAFERLKAGQVESLDLDAIPGLVRHGPLHANALRG
ncbi:MAG: tRNA (adenosine(37)-N6)-threonylcarbamoyltransferase complex transferase subunit TsaD [Pirellulaceae bacterium]|nr:tRNA (adenosine(37)-N6)-threonylcarbamoyltransferase complex transferase subunit TsaD [Pirellulaceae bacterium]